MVKYEDECVGCPHEMGCYGRYCPKRDVPHFYCDDCKDETDIYDFEGEELCIDCIIKRLIKINDQY